jgi:hypothetical protein
MGGSPDTSHLTYPYPAAAADCDGDGGTDVAEVITAVNIALGNLDVSACLPAAMPYPCPNSSGGAAGLPGSGGDYCPLVTIIDIERDIFSAVSGPGDPIPLPPLSFTPVPDPCEPCTDCAQCQSGHCGGSDCSFCESACPDVCFACRDDYGEVSCDNCAANGHCGGEGCLLCESGACDTPTPPPTPTPTQTAACTIVMGRQDPNNGVLQGYDCQAMYAAVRVQAPFVQESGAVTTSWLPDSLPLKPVLDSHGAVKYFKALGFIVGAGPFSATVTAYGHKADSQDGDTSHELCSRVFDTPRALGVCAPPLACPPDLLGDDLMLCGLGRYPTPGLVSTPPATVTLTTTPTRQVTPTPTAKCSIGDLVVGGLTQAQVLAKSQGKDPGTCPCNTLHFSASVSPPGAATNVHLHITNNTTSQVVADRDFCPAVASGAVCDVAGGRFEHFSVVYEGSFACRNEDSVTYTLTAYNGQNVVCGRSYSVTVTDGKDGGAYCDCAGPPPNTCYWNEDYLLCGCGFNADGSACNCCEHDCGGAGGAAASGGATFGVVSSTIPASADVTSFALPFQ